MKYASKIACFLLLAALSSTSFGMTRALMRKSLSPQQRMIHTKALSQATKTSPSFFDRMQQKFNEFKTAGWNTWTWLTGRPPQAPAITIPQSVALQQPLSVPIKPSTQKPALIGRSETSLITQLETAQSLSEMEHILKNNEAKEHNKQQTLLNISTEQWLAMLKKEEEHFAWIKNNCFKNKNITSDDRAKIPQERYAQIMQCFKTIDLDPLSIKLVWEKITTPDIFGHKAIITNGPIVNNATTGLEEIPTITFDPDKVSTLLPEEFDFELYHAITHLIQGDHDKLHLLKNTVGPEKFNQYTQSEGGKKYLTALDENANFLAPIRDSKIAHISQKYFLNQTFKLALEAIENNYADHNIKDDNSSKIACLSPEGELLFLKNITSLEELKKYFANEREKIYEELSLHKHQIEELESKFLIKTNQLNEYYKEKKEEEYDPALPIHQRELAKKILKEMRIEPSSIPIKSLYNAGHEGSVTFEDWINQKGDKIHRPILTLTPRDATDLRWRFTLAHEIGHIVLNHNIEKKILYDFLGSETFDFENKPDKERNKIMKTVQQYRSLLELEADAWVSIKHPDIALDNYYAIQDLYKKEPRKGHAWQPWEFDAPTYLTTIQRLHLFKYIVELHAKKPTLNNKVVNADITKE